MNHSHQPKRKVPTPENSAESIARTNRLCSIIAQSILRIGSSDAANEIVNCSAGTGHLFCFPETVLLKSGAPEWRQSILQKK